MYINQTEKLMTFFLSKPNIDLHKPQPERTRCHWGKENRSKKTADNHYYRQGQRLDKARADKHSKADAVELRLFVYLLFKIKSLMRTNDVRTR